MIAVHEVLTDAQLNRKLQLSSPRFKEWKNTSFQERADKMNLARILRENKEKLGLLITNEMGKIVSESIAEVEKSAGNCDSMLKNAEQMLKEEYYDTPF